MKYIKNYNFLNITIKNYYFIKKTSTLFLKKIFIIKFIFLIIIFFSLFIISTKIEKIVIWKLNREVKDLYSYYKFCSKGILIN